MEIKKGSSSCSGSGLSLGLGSLPGLVLFESGLTGMGLRAYPLRYPNRPANRLAPLFESEPLQLDSQ